MTRRTLRRSLAVTGLAASLSAIAAPALAQNREHLQIFADLRMLQEQVARLQKNTADLDEQLKAVNKRLDDQASANLKEFADQRVQLNNLGTTITALREKLDDNAVAVRQLTPEVSAIREGVGMLTTALNQILSLLQPAAAPSGGAGTEVPPGGAPPAGGAGVTMPPSPKALYDQAMSNYVANRMDLAIEGFKEVIERYPTATDFAADAQFKIGDSYFFQGKFAEALAAYQAVVKNYKDSRTVPDAMYQQGLCYERLNRKVEALRVYGSLITTFKDSTARILAEQRVKSIGEIK